MTYWHYTYMNDEAGIGYGVGIQKSPYDEFDFSGYYRNNPNCLLLYVNQISKRQFNELDNLIKKEKEK